MILEEPEEVRYGEQSFIKEPGNIDGIPLNHINSYKIIGEEIIIPNNFTTVIDIGCGCGYGALLLQAYFYMGCDDKDYCIEFAKKNVQPYVKGIAEYYVQDANHDLMFKDSCTEVITMHESLEHLTNDGAKNVIKECKRILKPGGIASFTVPILTSDGGGGGGSPWHLTLMNLSMFKNMVSPIGKIIKVKQEVMINDLKQWVDSDNPSREGTMIWVKKE